MKSVSDTKKLLTDLGVLEYISFFNIDNIEWLKVHKVGSGKLNQGKISPSTV